MPNRRELRVALAAAPGGHLTELLRLRPAYAEHRHFFVLNAHESGRADGLGRVHTVPDYGAGRRALRVLAVARLVAASVRIFLTERPNVLVTTGPGTGLALAALVRATGGDVVYVECSAQVVEPSRSGRAFRRLATRFYVQWPGLLEHFPRARYRGLLL